MFYILNFIVGMFCSVIDVGFIPKIYTFKFMKHTLHVCVYKKYKLYYMWAQIKFKAFGCKQEASNNNKYSENVIIFPAEWALKQNNFKNLIKALNFFFLLFCVSSISCTV